MPDLELQKWICCSIVRPPLPNKVGPWPTPGIKACQRFSWTCYSPASCCLNRRGTNEKPAWASQSGFRVHFSRFGPLVRAIAPGAVISTEELGRAMIRAARQGAPKRVLETRDLRALGAR